MKKNCWEVKNCGRESGGDNEEEKGTCPASINSNFNKINNGTNGGRVCWQIAGTFCKGEIQGEVAKKIFSCLDCDFFHSVYTEEGENFTLFESDDLIKILKSYSKRMESLIKNVEEKNKELVDAQEIIKENERNKAFESMIITYNHQINNPLAVALGYLSVAQQEAHSGNVKECLDNIRLALDRVVNIVNKMSSLQNSKEYNLVKYCPEKEMIDLSNGNANTKEKKKDKK